VSEDNATIDGLDSILRKLTILETKSSGKVLAAIVRAQLTVIRKQMKADVSSKVKEGRKGVRSRFKNSARKNVIQAKVGFGVGKKQRAKKAYPKKINRMGNKSGGVGISAQNFHWWVAGTKLRQTKRDADRGEMPSMQLGLASIAQQKSAGKQNAEMIKRGALVLEKELKKIKST